MESHATEADGARGKSISNRIEQDRFQADNAIANEKQRIADMNQSTLNRAIEHEQIRAAQEIKRERIRAAYEIHRARAEAEIAKSEMLKMEKIANQKIEEVNLSGRGMMALQD